MASSSEEPGISPQKKSRKRSDRDHYSFASRLWMAKNYKIVEGSVTNLDQIISMYQSVRQNVSFELGQASAAALVRELFGERVKGFHPRGNDGKRRLAFLNLGIRQTSDAVATQTQPQAQTHGWIERGKTETGTNFVKFTGDKVNGSDHSLKLVVNNDLSFNISGTCGAFSTVISEDVIGFTAENSPNSVDLPFILHYTGSLHPCLGFPKTDRHCKVMRHPTEDTAVTEIDVNGKARLISNACGLVIRKKDSFCQGCTAAQRLLRKRKTEFKNLKWTKNSVLSAQELCQKLEIMKKEKRNTERRLAFWKEKFERQCGEVDGDDQ